MKIARTLRLTAPLTAAGLVAAANSDGIGFAIPSDTVVAVANRLVAGAA